MHLISNEFVACFDVDETLVLEREPEGNERLSNQISIFDPYDSSLQFRIPHERHIRLLKQMHGRGRLIIVWSGSGCLWAKTVIEALGLTEYVHYVMTKPVCYIDDLQASEWMNNRIYLEERV